MYQECSEKYRLHYIQNLRQKQGKSALLFGNAIDHALNILVETKDLHKAQTEFINKWSHNTINNVLTDLRIPGIVQFSKSDLDPDLAESEWDCLAIKGTLILEEYNKQVIPKMKRVIAVQKPIELKNVEGDIIRGALDLIVEWEDGKVYLMDNKTSSVKYTPTSAKESPQLSLYHYLEKDTYGLQGVGFIVIDKKIEKIITKTCSECGDVKVSVRNTNCMVKKCPGKLLKSNVEFKVNIDYIINEVDEKVVYETIEVFDRANEGISNEIFEQNRDACFGKFGKCAYYNYCHKSDDSELVQLPTTK